jgi:hypothetical protein
VWHLQNCQLPLSPWSNFSFLHLSFPLPLPFSLVSTGLARASWRSLRSDSFDDRMLLSWALFLLLRQKLGQPFSLLTRHEKWRLANLRGWREAGVTTARKGFVWFVLCPWRDAAFVRMDKTSQTKARCHYAFPVWSQWGTRKAFVRVSSRCLSSYHQAYNFSTLSQSNTNDCDKQNSKRGARGVNASRVGFKQSGASPYGWRSGEQQGARSAATASTVKLTVNLRWHWEVADMFACGLLAVTFAWSLLVSSIRVSYISHTIASSDWTCLTLERTARDNNFLTTTHF